MSTKRPPADLTVSFIGHSLKTPFLLAAGAQTTVIGNLQKHAESLARYGWSGVVAKTVTLGKPVYVKPYLWGTDEYRLKAMQNSGSRLIPWDGQMLEKLKRDVEALHHHRLVILGSISGSTSEEFEELASYMEEAGVDGIELDVSCPSEVRSTTERMRGIGSVEQAYASGILSDTKRSFSRPIVAKLSFHTYEMGHLAKACEKAGASALSAINTIQGVIGIDLDSGVPICSGFKKNSYRSGISGPLIKPFGLSAVSKICSVTQLPVSGVGGISDWKGVLEYIMVGATTVQVCTAAMWHGFKLGQTLSRGVETFMRQQGYRSLQEVRGISLPFFTSEVPMPENLRASINLERCKGCGLCLIACRDGAYDAIRRMNSSYNVNHDLCDGCGLCLQVCSEKAIRLKKIALT